jgi:transposase-like protein
MPWKENRAMDLRVQLIQEYDEGESISALAQVYGVARALPVGLRRKLGLEAT